jgi:hypothetical protein
MKGTDMAKRPQLTGSPIAARAAAKPARETDDVPSAAAAKAASPKDVKSVMARINRDGWQAIRRLALELDTTTQALIVDALNDVLRKNGHQPVVESRLPDKPG